MNTTSFRQISRDKKIRDELKKKQYILIKSKEKGANECDYYMITHIDKSIAEGSEPFKLDLSKYAGTIPDDEWEDISTAEAWLRATD